MKPAPFELHAPVEVDDVVGLLAEHGDDAKVLAGGQSLVPLLALRLARVPHLVDVNEVAALSSVSAVADGIRIGAMTRQRRVERDEVIGGAVPLLAVATAHIGHFQIRSRGTLGGTLAHADPAAEYPAVAVALDATMHVVSSSSRRDVAATDFFEGPFTTALGVDELLEAVTLPAWSGRTGFAVEEVARRHGDFALVGAVGGIALDDAGAVRDVALALFGVGPAPHRARDAEVALIGATSQDVLADVARLAVDGLEPPDDLHASGTYRREVGAVLVERALRAAWDRAIGGRAGAGGHG